MKTLLALNLVVLTLCHAAVIYEEIYYGRNAKPGQFPYQAYLSIKKKTGTFGCGGALISRNYVLTVAHCTHKDLLNVKVYLGMTDREKQKDVSIYTIPKSGVHEHPQYNSVTHKNDICLISLPSPVKLSKLIKTVALPHQSWAGPNTFLHEKITVSGFGKTENGKTSNILKYTEVTIFPFKDCERLLEKRVKGSKVLSGMTCTAVGHRNSQSCQGDSGGPLTVKKSSRVYVIALVSWGDVCKSNTPSANTDVAYFLPWINKVTAIPIEK